MNLTPEQMELLIRLVGAIVIGFIFGYILAKSFAKERYGQEIGELEQLLDDKDDEIEKSSTKYGQLKQHLAVQASELKSVNMQIVEAQESAKTFQDKTNILSAEKEELTAVLKQKDVLLEQSDAQTQNLNQELGYLKNELVDVQQLAEEYKSVNKDQKEKVLAFKSEMEKNAISNEEKNMLSKKVDQLAKTNHEKEIALEELKKQNLFLGKFKQEKEELELKVDRLSREQLSIKKELNQKDANIINLEKKSMDLELEQRKANELKTLVSDDSKQELEILREKLQLKEKSLELAEDKLQQSESKIKRFQNNTKDLYTSTTQTIKSKKNKWDFSELAIVKFAKDKLGQKINIK